PCLLSLTPPPPKDVWPTPKALVSQARSDGCGAALSFLPLPEEKITRGKYGEGAKPETFTFALTLVFIQCVINAVFAKIWWIALGAGSMLPARSPIWVPWSPATQHYSLSTIRLRSLVNPASQSQVSSRRWSPSTVLTLPVGSPLLLC
uniref:Uncharacterized protein n=1 Tax=Panthera tigris altaica TaxID=74533 RepID=A0A8C9KQV3_PANTA